MDNQKFYHKKSLGQNFLTDKNIIKKISGFILDLKPARFFEIGPGNSDIAKIISPHIPSIVIEKDQRLYSIIKGAIPDSEIIISDIRDIDFYNYNISGEDLLFSNLPYCSATNILQYLIMYQPHFGNYILMFQREVAQRIMAKEHTRNYCYISVITQLLFNVRKLLSLSPSVFSPKPKVHSELLLFRPHHKYRFKEPILLIAFTDFIKKAFSQKRKKLKAVLKMDSHRIDDKIRDLMERRPHQISVEDYLYIFNQMQAR